jgi:hypothetical protein
MLCMMLTTAIRRYKLLPSSVSYLTGYMGFCEYYTFLIPKKGRKKLRVGAHSVEKWPLQRPRNSLNFPIVLFLLAQKVQQSPLFLPLFLRNRNLYIHGNLDICLTSTLKIEASCISEESATPLASCSV